MKKIFLILSLLSVVACQDETTDKTPQAPNVYQGVFLDGNNAVEVYVQEYQDNKIEGLKVKLIRAAGKIVSAELITGDAQTLADYNAQYGTDYKLLPTDNYSIDENAIFNTYETETPIDITVSELTFPNNEVYALPIQIRGRNNIEAIAGQDRLLLVIHKGTRAKVLRMGNVQATTGEVLSNELSQWTLEATVNCSNLTGNNPIIGVTSTTHQVEIGFANNQLAVKVLDISVLIPTEVFKAQTNKWYPIAVTYDSNTLRVYVEGKEVGSKTVDNNVGKIYVKDLWLAGANELLREVRLWKRAVTQKEIQSQLWSTLKPTNDLLLYYPLNGKRYDKTSNAIIDDETKLWDWSATGTLIELPTGTTFDNGTGYGIVFPPQ
ncbi:hypothetical protein RCZ04_15130 [Capnocytophaga sp. HP1101]